MSVKTGEDQRCYGASKSTTDNSTDNNQLLLVITTNEMARPDGFEPPTPWFVARYSIQLSYGR